ncbi:hypothetical protein PO909_010656 [Leuciscus waleckii]
MSACNHSEQGVRGKPHVSLKKLKVACDKTVNSDGEAFMFEKTMFYVFKFSLNICRACCVVYAFKVWNHHSCPKRHSHRLMSLMQCATSTLMKQGGSFESSGFLVSTPKH